MERDIEVSCTVVDTSAMTSTGLTTTATHATPALFNADASNELIAGIVAGTFGECRGFLSLKS